MRAENQSDGADWQCRIKNLSEKIEDHGVWWLLVVYFYVTFFTHVLLPKTLKDYSFFSKISLRTRTLFKNFFNQPF